MQIWFGETYKTPCPGTSAGQMSHRHHICSQPKINMSNQIFDAACYKSKVQALFQAIMEDINHMPARNERQKLMLLGVLQGIEGVSPVDVLEKIVNVCLPKGHFAKEIGLLRVHGPERCGKSAWVLFPAFMTKYREFQAIVRMDDNFSRAKVGALSVVGPYVKNELRSLKEYAEKFECGNFIQGHTIKKNAEAYEANYIFGNNYKHAEKLLHVCQTNSETVGTEFPVFNPLSSDESDLLFGQNMRGDNYSVTEGHIRQALTCPNVTGHITTTATDFNLFSPENPQDEHLRDSICTGLGNLRAETLRIRVADDYVGFDDIGNYVTIREYVRGKRSAKRRSKNNPEPSVQDPFDNNIIKPMVQNYIASGNIVGDGNHRLARIALILSDTTIDRMHHVAETISRDHQHALCLTFCDKDRFSAYVNGHRLSIDEDTSTFSLEDMVNICVQDQIPPIIIVAGNMAKRGATFQFTLRRGNITYLGYVKEMLFDFAPTVQTPIQSVKQKFMRFAMKLNNFFSWFTKEQLDIVVHVPDHRLVDDITEFERINKQLRNGATAPNYSGFKVASKSYKGRKIEDAARAFGGNKVPRLDEVVEEPMEDEPRDDHTATIPSLPYCVRFMWDMYLTVHHGTQYELTVDVGRRDATFAKFVNQFGNLPLDQVASDRSFGNTCIYRPNVGPGEYHTWRQASGGNHTISIGNGEYVIAWAQVFKGYLGNEILSMNDSEVEFVRKLHLVCPGITLPKIPSSVSDI